MTDLAELERRIVAALARVDAGLDRLQAQAAVAMQAPAPAPVAQAEPVIGADPWVAEPEPSGAEQAMSSALPEATDLAEVTGQTETSEPLPDGVSEEISEAVETPSGNALEVLQAALAAEKAQVAALTDRIRTLKGRESRNEAALQARIDQLTKQLDVQGLELHRLRKSMIQLREALRVLREGADGACVDAAMINKAMLAELEGLRAARSSETVELEEIIAELAALTGEEKADA